MVCLCEWMTHPVWSKWGDLLCGSVVTSYGLWQKPVGGLYWPANAKCLLQEPTRNGQSMWTKLSFLCQTFQSLWPFHNSLGIRSTNLIWQIIDFHGTCDLCCYCVLYSGPKLGLVVKKCLASLGIKSSETRCRYSSKSTSEVKGYSDWNCNGFFSFGNASS